jgi:pimeloyl-ACP methyl ester carboxylesterase
MNRQEHMRIIFVNRIVLAVFLLTLSSCNIQRDMLYFPSTYLPPQASLTDYNIQFWPSDSNGYRGFISTVHTGKTKGTIIVFHGNAGTAADRVYYVEALAQLGYRVILAEYPGYGGRKGELGEESFVHDAKETVRLASEHYGAPIFLLGESLGCGVVTAVGKDLPVKVEGIILITPWDTLLSIAREKFPWLPVRLFLRDKYDSIDNLKEYRGRIAIIGAELDEVVPIQHAQSLFRSLSGSKGVHEMRTIRGAGHNDWPDRVDRAWWKGLTDFIQGNNL